MSEAHVTMGVGIHQRAKTGLVVTLAKTITKIVGYLQEKV